MLMMSGNKLLLQFQHIQTPLPPLPFPSEMPFYALQQTISFLSLYAYMYICTCIILSWESTCILSMASDSELKS